MTDLKITELTDNLTPALTDILAMVDDPSGTPETQRVTLQAVGDLLRSDNLVFVATASAVLADSDSETSIIGTGVGSLTLASGFLTVGKSLRVVAAGLLSDTGTPTLTLNLKLGSTVILTSGPITLPDTITDKMLRIEAELTCRTTGGSGSVFAQGIIYLDDAIIPFVADAAVTVATNTTQGIGLTAEWSDDDPSNSLTITNVSITKMN